jgi:hypothetical protein
MFLRIYAQEGKRLPRSFESFVAALSDWRGMFIEMDGSFVWSIVVDGLRHQIDGMVYDREGAIEYLELKGNLTPDSWTQLLQTLADDAAAPSAWNDLYRIHDVARQTWNNPSGILEELRVGGGRDGD